MYINIKTIVAYHPCKDVWESACHNRGVDPYSAEARRHRLLSLKTIYKLAGFEGALWCLRASSPNRHRDILRLALSFYEIVLDEYYDGDIFAWIKVREFYQIALKYVKGKITYDAYNQMRGEVLHLLIYPSDDGLSMFRMLMEDRIDLAVCDLYEQTMDYAESLDLREPHNVRNAFEDAFKEWLETV